MILPRRALLSPGTVRRALIGVLAVLLLIASPLAPPVLAETSPTPTYAAPEIADGAPPPEPPAGGWLVGDPDTGEVWAGEDIETGFAPASVLKLLSALALEPVLDDRDEVYTGTEAEVRIDGTKVGMVDGGEYTIDQLFHAMIMSSANDASYALAEAAGGQDEAVALMNAKLAELGLADSHAANTSGLDADGQVLSARDLMVIAGAFSENEYLMDVAGTETYDWPEATDREGRDWDGFQIQNHTRIVGNVEGGLGLKNGYTENARGSFVALAERDGRRVVSVLLKNETMTRQVAVDLLDWGFAQVDPEPIATVAMTPEPAAAPSAPPHPVASADRASVADGQGPASIAGLGPGGWWGVAGLAGLMLLLGAGAGLARRKRRRRPPRRRPRRPGNRKRPARRKAAARPRARH